MVRNTLHLRPFLADLEPYTPGEQISGRKIVKLNTNENPYPPPPVIIEEIQAAAQNLHLYPNPTSQSLRKVLAAYHDVGEDQILVGNGSDEILRLLIHAFISKGDKIAVVDPTYSLYPVLSASFEGETAVYPLEDDYALPQALFDAPEPLILLPNPNPPIGTLYSRADIRHLCRARPDRLVVIDEAYVDFAARDAVPLLREFENLAVTRTFSKSFSLAGMRIGYLLADSGLVAELMKIKDSYNMNRLAQVAGATAVAAYGEMLKNTEKIVEEREAATKALEQMGYRVPESHCNFIFAVHPDAEKHFLELRRQGILVRWFDKPRLRDGMRITIGTPQQMQQLLDALKEINGSNGRVEKEKAK